MSVTFTTNLNLAKQTDEPNWGSAERANWQAVEDKLAGTASQDPSSDSAIGYFKGQGFFDWNRMTQWLSAAVATTATGSTWTKGWSYSTGGGPMLQNGQILSGLTSATAEQNLLSLSTGNNTVVYAASGNQFSFTMGTSVVATIDSSGFDLSGTNGEGTRTASTSTPSGGSDGDIWYELES